MSVSTDRGKLGSRVKLLDLFFRMSSGDPTEEQEDDRGGGGDREIPPGMMEQGKRGEEWFNRADRLLVENRKRGEENKNYLSRLDYRTVWIMRLLVGLIVTIIGGVIAQIVFQDPTIATSLLQAPR